MSSSNQNAGKDKGKGKETVPTQSTNSNTSTSAVLEPPQSSPSDLQIPPVPSRPLSDSNSFIEPACTPQALPTTPPTDEVVTPHALLPLLQCPQCSPPKLLVTPTTLNCGHTICSEHVTLTSRNVSSAPLPRPGPPSMPACPLPTCLLPLPTFLRPNIPPESNVVYFPPPIHPRTPTTPVRGPSRVSETRLDVTIGKVLDLVQRAAEWQAQDNEAVPTLQCSDDGSGCEDADRVRNDDILTSVRDSSSLPTSRPTQKQHVRRPTQRPQTGPQNSVPIVPSQLNLPSSRFSKELFSELTCEICFMLIYAPVTTPCQHTFCLKCLQRALDHNAQCPLCRTDMPGFTFPQDHPPNKLVLALILKAFPESYADRKSTTEAEERDVQLDTPIFVCQLSFPGTPTILHIYEPRYRLMIRRCLEKPSPRFGMIMPPRRTGERTAFGTMLEIRTVQMFVDGRSMVETWGVHRFRILETGDLDGYMVGRIEVIEDLHLDVDGTFHANTTSPDLGLVGGVVATNEELIQFCHSFLDKLRNRTAPWVVQRLNHTYGPEPDDPISFSFWMALVLPIDEYEKAKLLPIRSPQLRLRLVVHWIERLNNTWSVRDVISLPYSVILMPWERRWVSNGCVIG
ncbi:PUA-like domain-containing protein [Hysterangium stoloniferum]|nr:PUA-like domain-containing protein [Hysterangium stoloniferum]